VPPPDCEGWQHKWQEQLADIVNPIRCMKRQLYARAQVIVRSSMAIKAPPPSTADLNVVVVRSVPDQRLAVQLIWQDVLMDGEGTGVAPLPAPRMISAAQGTGGLPCLCLFSGLPPTGSVRP